MRFIVDNSVVAGWALSQQANDYSRGVLGHLESAVAHVPPIWELEFTNVLRNHCLRGRLDAQIAQTLLERIVALGLVVERNIVPMSEVLGLALRHRLSSYDAAYLDLALRLQCPLATQDEALRDAAMACGVGVLKV
jgi:predicted nucleic acid-binding protein